MAIKILDKTKLDQKTQRLLSREISSMEKLHHPNIIRLYEVVETLSKLHLVMEYAGGGELFGKISTEGKFSESESKLIFSQIVSAVKHMVSRGGGRVAGAGVGGSESCSHSIHSGAWGCSLPSKHPKGLLQKLPGVTLSSQMTHSLAKPISPTHHPLTGEPASRCFLALPS